MTQDRVAVALWRRRPDDRVWTDTLSRGDGTDRVGLSRTLLMGLEHDRRPPWLNWLFLLIFLWSSWQLAGLWFERIQ